MRMRLVLGACVLACAAAAMTVSAVADEGMWTFDNFPAAKVKLAYGFAPDQKWLDRVRLGSVRLENGCSGAVVSRDGLVLTNHRCVDGCTTALSSPGNDYTSNGFFTQSRRDERICPGAEISILKAISDVTARVKAATVSVAEDAAGAARASEYRKIEQEACGEDLRKRCQVANLYRGGQYKLYVYDRYDDVRIAFAPEMQAGSFGGDPDNFNFPRYALDMALLRLYRDGQPAKFTDPLRLDPAGPKAGDLVFVSGYPGSTDRLLTVSQLEFQRDHFLPWRIEYMSELRGALLNEASRGEEEARQVGDVVRSIENSLKVFKGQRGALVEPSFMAAKIDQEQRLAGALAGSESMRAKYGDLFAAIADLKEANKRLFLPYQMLEVRFGAGSVLLNDARQLVRAAAERAKPDSDRLSQFTDAGLAGVERRLLAEATVNPVLERLVIAFWLDKTREYLGPEHPAVKALFGSRTSGQIAAEIVQSSQMSDASFRKRLWDKPAEVAGSNDPAIVLARGVDDAARAARASYESGITAPAALAAEKVAALRFEILGDSIYPDATFTLRLSYGVVQGWNDPIHGQIEPFTYVSGLWKRATGAYPFNLARSWVAKETAIPPATQFDFVSTSDVVGGGSGSPVVNRDGRIVGLAFDGNIHATGGSFGFDPELNRTVSLSSQMIVAALGSVYGAHGLLDELTR